MSGSLLDEAVHHRHARRLLRQFWAGLGRGDRILVGLVAGVILLRVVLYVVVAGAPIYGDEEYYVDGGRALSNLVRDLVSFNGPDAAELRQNVVGSGWFMPGMSVLLTPLFVVVPDAPAWLIRGYLGVATTGILLLAVLVVRRHLGRVPAAGMLVFPGLVPMYAIFGFAAYGDLIAGLLVVVLLCQALEMLRRVQAGLVVTWRHGIDLGVLGIIAVYFRSSVSILVVGVCAVTAIAALVLGRREARVRIVSAFVAAGVAFVGLLLPWSAYASHELGGRVITTTSVPTVMANTFGDRSEVCYGECDPGSSIWFSPLRYSREVARATGISEMDAAVEMSTYARSDVTPQSYSRTVLENLARYSRSPSGFAPLLTDPSTPTGVVWAIQASTVLLFFPALAIGLVMLLVVVRRDAFSQVQAVLLKVAIGALMVQPFVHICGSRYWTTLGPLLGLSAAALWARRRSPADPAHDGGPVRWLSVMQGVLVAATVLVAVGVLGLAI